MRGYQVNEFNVAYPAMQIWAIYSTLLLPDIVRDIPNLLKDIRVTGDGSVGTQFELFTLPGAPFQSFKEQIVKLDQKRMIKEVRVIEGGVLTIGYTLFLTRFEIIPKGRNLTTVKSSYTYKLRDANYATEAGTSVAILGTILNAVLKYIRQN